MPIPKAGLFSFHAVGGIGKGKKALMGKAVVPPAPPREYTEEQTTCISVSLLYAAYPRMGQWLAISDRKVTKLAFYIYKAGSPSGDLILTIRKIADDGIIASKLWGNAADLPSGATWIEVTFDTPTLINEGVKILAEFYSGDETNYIGFRRHFSDVKAGEAFVYWRLDTETYVLKAEWDACYRYKYYLP